MTTKKRREAQSVVSEVLYLSTLLYMLKESERVKIILTFLKWEALCLNEGIVKVKRRRAKKAVENNINLVITNLTNC